MAVVFESWERRTLSPRRLLLLQHFHDTDGADNDGADDVQQAERRHCRVDDNYVTVDGTSGGFL